MSRVPATVAAAAIACAASIVGAAAPPPPDASAEAGAALARLVSDNAGWASIGALLGSGDDGRTVPFSARAASRVRRCAQPAAT